MINALISTYNRREALARTVEALLAQDYPLAGMTLTVLDDCGTDGTAEELVARRGEFLARGLADLRVLRNARNMGIARNRGFLRRSSGKAEYLLYLDDDVYMEKGAVRALLACLKAHPDCGMAGPRLVYACDPERTAHCANFVGKWSGRYSELDANVETECDWLNFSCFLVRASAAAGVRHVGDFYTAHEEVDYCLQLGKAGWKLRYCPSVKALHDIPPLGGGRRDRLYYLYRNKLLVFRRNFPPLRRLIATAVTVFLGLPLYILESLRHNRGSNFRELGLIFRAVFDGLAGRYGRR